MNYYTKQALKRDATVWLSWFVQGFFQGVGLVVAVVIMNAIFKAV